jgi:hypothetical protein
MSTSVGSKFPARKCKVSCEASRRTICACGDYFLLVAEIQRALSVLLQSSIFTENQRERVFTQRCLVKFFEVESTNVAP